MHSSDSSHSSPVSPTRSPAAEIIREAGLAVAAIVAVARLGDLALAGRIDGNHALVGICVIVVPGLAAAGGAAIAGLVRRR